MGEVVEDIPEKSSSSEFSCKVNNDHLASIDFENNLFTKSAKIKNELSSGKYEFVELASSVAISDSFAIETRSENEICNYYNNVKRRDNLESSKATIKIEITPDLPCNLETGRKPKPDVCDSGFDEIFETAEMPLLTISNVKLCNSNFYRCIHCEKEYETKRNIARHLKLSDCKGELEPDKDNKKLLKPKKRGPRIVKLANDRYQCRHCKKTYTQKNNLFRHMSEDHVKLSKPTCCDVCGKEFYNFRKLHQHLRSHTERPYECLICCKRFSQMAHLHSHTFTHTGEKPYQCKICDKRFSKSFNLKIHIVRHNGAKQFKCRTCHTEFFTHGELEKHFRIHKTERPYSCNTCGKCFKQNSHLKKHLLSHTGQKPYKCTMCDKDYVNSSHLKRHILTHTGEKLPQYVCPICGNNFSQPSTVKRHIAKVHRKCSSV